MVQTKKTYLVPLILTLLFSLMAQCTNQGIAFQIDSGLANQYGIEMDIEKDGESDLILHPFIIDAVLSFVFIPNIKEEFYDFRVFCLDNPPPLLLKVDRTILFRSLKIHIS